MKQPTELLEAISRIENYENNDKTTYTDPDNQILQDYIIIGKWFIENKSHILVEDDEELLSFTPYGLYE